MLIDRNAAASLDLSAPGVIVGASCCAPALRFGLTADLLGIMLVAKVFPCSVLQPHPPEPPMQKKTTQLRLLRRVMGLPRTLSRPPPLPPLGLTLEGAIQTTLCCYAASTQSVAELFGR
jgi:hypothetical protein